MLQAWGRLHRRAVLLNVFGLFSVTACGLYLSREVMRVKSCRVKRLLLISGLFPRPDLPRCGVFNAHFASALARALDGGQRPEVRGRNSELGTRSPVPSTLHSPPPTVLVPVPEWRLWRHRHIRRWKSPEEVAALSTPQSPQPTAHPQPSTSPRPLRPGLLYSHHWAGPEWVLPSVGVPPLP